MSRDNRSTYKETIWLTNKYSPELKLIICKGKGQQKPESFIPKLTKFETPINAQQQINSRSLLTTSEHCQHS